MTTTSSPVPPAQPDPLTFEALLDRARGLVAAPGRHVLGVAGTPGAGKSTLAVQLVRALAAGPVPAGCEEGWVAHVPMDGYHLADVELERLGRRGAKGAPDTFDAHGFAALLERVRAPREGEVVYAPMFERDLEQPIAGAMPVLPACRLAVTEGNYLLLDGPGWERARAAMDEVWFCEVPEAERAARLLERHVRFGKTREEALAWIAAVDDPNAALILATAGRADLTVPVAVVPPLDD
ncbi:nucleoside/nucleotide kinase family protein [Nocardioides sp. GY 10127]|uniref:nucleoside/nucleotide kinase family protein n=1 Tax=Nocardioides sp. GY 10127 TaxID=2569762 RepID=UPI0010A94C29|nr:nucleoside/nucleotide kinase family protein [Nocardioides sp. GY 10127]TIC81565.1 nucleoside/nucleotide kinase family protein [Nocardioides sp. GY 10127]